MTDRAVKRESLERFFFAVCRPLGPLYGLIMRARAVGYSKGIIAQERLPIPVVSVGNLTLGGTGKTPTVLCVAKFLQQAGYRPAVVSRGYGGRARKSVNVVSDGERLLLSAEEAGDEPRLLAELLHGVPVLTGVRRGIPARYAMERFNVGCVVLDDGFQHLALHRDIDLVLVNGRRPFLEERIFPAGRLREPFAALRRAKALVITNSRPDDGSEDRLRDWFKKFLPDTPVFTSHYQAIGVVDAASGVLHPLESIREQPLFAFCGLASPGGFRDTLKALGLPVKGFMAFADHCRYTREDFQALAAVARQTGAGTLITTEKDLVKVRSFAADYTLLALRVELRPEAGLMEMLLRHLGTVGKRPIL